MLKNLIKLKKFGKIKKAGAGYSSLLEHSQTTNLSEDQLAFQEVAKNFSETELMPNAMKWDAEKNLNRDTLKQAAQLGFAGIFVKEDMGGLELSRLDGSLIFEQLAMGCISHTAMLTIHNMSCAMIDRYGSESLREKFLPDLCAMDKIASYCLTEPGSGSDASSLTTKAEKRGNDHYILNGEKQFISGAGFSDLYLVMARTGEKGPKGVSCFLVEKEAAGLSFGKNIEKMGWNAQPTAPVIFDNCEIPVENLIGKEGEGFKFAMAGLDGGRINIGSCSLGGAQRALDLTVEYVKQRKQFGKKLCDFQNTQFKLSELATELHAARLLIRNAAFAYDSNNPHASSLCSMSKLYSSQICSKITDECLQLHGGYGYTKEYEIERIFRDLRVHQILEGTSEIMKMIISRNLLKD